MFKPRLMVLALLAALAWYTPASQAQSGSGIRAKLYSANASEEASGPLMLDGYNLAGHLTGGGVDVTISGTVKSSGVSVVVTGRIMANCSLNRQSTSGEGENQGLNTSIPLVFSCTTKAGNFGGGQDYLFHLDLALPSPHLQLPANPGEDADRGAKPSGKIQGDPA
jgi:hypothetical protein